MQQATNECTAIVPAGPAACSDDEETEVVLATSARASRAARPPLPSNREEVVRIVQQLEQALQNLLLTPFSARRTRHRYQTSSSVGTTAGPAWRHMISIHSKSVDSLFRDQQHVAFLQGHSPRVTELIRIGIRFSSVRVSLVYQKSLKVAGAKMGSSQQTTRVNVHPVCTAWAAQSVAVATTLGMVAQSGCVKISDPRSGQACDANDVFRMQGRGDYFVVAATSRTPAHALPTRLVASSLLATMREMATSELTEESISTAIRQPAGDALQNICKRVVHDSSAGDSIWASLALLSYLQSEPAGRRLLQTRSVSDIDAAVAATFLSYGRTEITRRSRLTDLQIAADQDKTASRSDSKNRAMRSAQLARIDDTIETMFQEELQDDDGGTPEAMGSVLSAMSSGDGEAADGDDDESTTSCATVVLTDRPPGRPPTTIEQQEKSRRKSTSTALVLRSAADEQRLVLCQKRKRGAGGSSGMVPPSALTLIYWDAALKSQHAHVLLMLLASSKSAAQRAADATVRSQVIEQDLLTNAMLKQLSEENAVRSAVALRTTVVQSADETPMLCVWREAGTKIKVGVARSRDDLSTCTLYACKRGMYEPHDDAAIRLAWTDSYYHATPSVLTAPFPGITESLSALAKHNRRVSGNNGVNVSLALKEAGRIKENLRGTLTSMKLSGIARGIIYIKTMMVVPESQVVAAGRLGAACDRASQEAQTLSAQTPGIQGEVLRPLKTSNLEKGAVLEPFTTPANNLVVALEASETVRALARGRSHCGDPAKAFFGLQRPRELADSWSQDFDRPSALLPLVDVEMKADPAMGKPVRMPTRPDAFHIPMTVQLTVGGEAPVRAPEAVYEVAQTKPYEARAMLFIAASTASLMSETALMSCAGALSTASAAAKRVLVADVNKRLFATPYEVYVNGQRNVKPSFTGTAWEGAFRSIQNAFHRSHVCSVVLQEAMEQAWTLVRREASGCGAARCLRTRGAIMKATAERLQS
jgi:hypothetical protein